jgi:hypothetical protein
MWVCNFMLWYGSRISPCLVMVQAAASASARPLLHCCQQVIALQHEHAAIETELAAFVWMPAHPFVDPPFFTSAWRILCLLLHMLSEQSTATLFVYVATSRYFVAQVL